MTTGIRLMGRGQSLPTHFSLAPDKAGMHISMMTKSGPWTALHREKVSQIRWKSEMIIFHAKGIRMTDVEHGEAQSAPMSPLPSHSITVSGPLIINHNE